MATTRKCRFRKIKPVWLVIYMHGDDGPFPSIDVNGRYNTRAKAFEDLASLKHAMVLEDYRIVKFVPEESR